MLVKRTIKKILSIDHKFMRKHVRIIHERNNRSYLYIYLDMIKNFFLFGSGHTDYFCYDFINISNSEKKDYLTASSYYKLMKYCIDPKNKELLDNKLQFMNYFKNYIKRPYIDLQKCSFEKFEKFLKKNKTVFAKTLDGFMGLGVEKITYKKCDNIKHLYSRLLNEKKFLVEKRVVQIDKFNKINPYSLTKIRILTLYSHNEPSVLSTFLYFNLGKNAVMGNDIVSAKINEEGFLTKGAFDEYGYKQEVHPITKYDFSEFYFPEIKEAIQMCKEAASKISKVRIIGWDVAYTQNGPELIEGNTFPGYTRLQAYWFGKNPFKPLIKNIFKDEYKKIGI